MWEEIELLDIWKKTSSRKVSIVICQISPSISLEEGIAKVDTTEEMLSKFRLIVEKINNSKTDELTIFNFPELSLSKNHINDLINVIESFERNLILITGIEHLIPEEAISIVKRCNNIPSSRENLINKLEGVSARDFYVNMGLVFTKEENSTKLFYFLKNKSSSVEQKEINKRFFKGEEFWLFKTPILNFTPFICYDFITREHGELMIPKLKKELYNLYPHFILTHIFIPTLRNINNDKKSKFAWNVENFFFVEPTEDIFSPLSQFCVMIFSNIALIDNLSNEKTEYGHSNVFFVGSEYDIVNRVPKYASIEKIARTIDIYREESEIQEEKEDRRKLNLIKVEIDSEKELYMYLQLKDYFYGDIDRIKDISILEIIDGRWHEY